VGLTLKCEPDASSLLDYYHCTFFLPLLGFGDGLTPHETLRVTYPHNERLPSEDAQAFYYFTPTLRDIIFDRGDVPLTEDEKRGKGQAGEHEAQLIPVREWRLEPEVVADWELQLLSGTESPDTGQRAVFESVRLYRYFNGIYLLAFTLMPRMLRELRDQVGAECQNLKQAHPDWPEWKIGQEAESEVPLFSSGRQFLDDYRVDGVLPEAFSAYESLQLESWLRFTRLARQLYPSFTEQGDENKIAPLKLLIPGQEPFSALDRKVPLQLPKAAVHLSPVIVQLVQQFFAEPVEQLLKEKIRLFDDRMFVSVAYGLAGKKYDNLDKLKALIATTDRFADTWEDMNGYAYSGAALDHYLQDSEFDLWTDLGGHFIFNDMVNAYLYSGSFFRSIIGPKHIPYIYDRMLIQVMFYQASLRHYDHEITNKTALLLKNRNEKNAIGQILQQRGEFIRFTNQYWFREVSNQMQGRMMFRLQYQGLEIDAHYRQLQDEIRDTNDYLQVLHENRQGEESARLTKLAVVFAVAAYYIAALPVLNDQLKNEGLWTQLFDGLLRYLPEDWVAPVLGILTVLIIPIVLAAAVYGWFAGWFTGDGR